MENVEAILFKANIGEFQRWIRTLDDLGYCSSYAVLNAKDFGVPQNRKRCFMVSTLHKGSFVFPKGWPLEKRLKDVLEDDVPESYYLSEDRIKCYEQHRIRHADSGHGFGWQLMDPEREREQDDSNQSAEGRNDGRDRPSESPRESDGIIVAGDLNIPGLHEQTNRVHSKEGIAPTITTGTGGGIMPKIVVKEEYR